MKKNLILGIGGVAIIVLGALVVTKRQKQSLPLEKVSGEPVQTQEEASGLEKISGGLKDLLSKGISMRCTYTENQGGMMTEGEIYVSGNKVRGDLEMTRSNGQKITSSMIQDDKFLYTWSTQSPQGTKMKLVGTDAQEPARAVVDEETGAISVEEVVTDYSCTPWKEDATYFALPAQMEFIDLNEQMRQ